MITSTPPSNLVLPFLVSEDCLKIFQDDNERTDSATYAAFYVQALKLLEILGDILSAFYRGSYNQSSNSNRSHGRGNLPVAPMSAGMVNIGDFQTLLKLDSSLTAWHDHLPSHLKVGADSERKGDANTPDIIRRQRNILQAR